MHMSSRKMIETLFAASGEFCETFSSDSRSFCTIGGDCVPYQALYRKYRPRSFSDVVGQEHITETLRRQVASGRTSHAYLFVGTRGTGKTTCAKILSRALNCEHPVDGDPCNACASCEGIESQQIIHFSRPLDVVVEKSYVRRRPCDADRCKQHF